MWWLLVRFSARQSFPKYTIENRSNSEVPMKPLFYCASRTRMSGACDTNLGSLGTMSLTRHAELWLPGFLHSRIERRLAPPPPPRRLWFFIADHYEPLG